MSLTVAPVTLSASLTHVRLYVQDNVTVPYVVSLVVEASAHGGVEVKVYDPDGEKVVVDVHVFIPGSNLGDDARLVCDIHSKDNRAVPIDKRIRLMSLSPSGDGDE